MSLPCCPKSSESLMCITSITGVSKDSIKVQTLPIAIISDNNDIRAAIMAFISLGSDIYFSFLSLMANTVFERTPTGISSLRHLQSGRLSKQR